MQHKVKVTVLDKKLYPELQEQYCSDPRSGPCPCYQVGDTFVFERYGAADDFWHIGLNTLRQPASSPAEGTPGTAVPAGAAARTAGGPAFPHCSEAWDAIARYIYTGLQGGSIMRGWMRDERVMITCCSDGTRPVIFKIERLDYKVLYVDGIGCDKCRAKIQAALTVLEGVTEVSFREDFTEVFLEQDVPDEALKAAVEGCGGYSVTRID